MGYVTVCQIVVLGAMTTDPRMTAHGFQLHTRREGAALMAKKMTWRTKTLLIVGYSFQLQSCCIESEELCLETNLQQWGYDYKIFRVIHEKRRNMFIAIPKIS